MEIRHYAVMPWKTCAMRQYAIVEINFREGQLTSDILGFESDLAKAEERAARYRRDYGRLKQ